MSRIRRIVYASDFSAASRRALAKALDVAKATHAELVVVHVLAPAMTQITSGETYVPLRTLDTIEAAARRAAQRGIDRFLRVAKKSGVAATSLLVKGVAAPEIVRAARTKHADLLVIGTHGRTGLPRAVLGSVAARVVATAPCPVLTVRR